MQRIDVTLAQLVVNPEINPRHASDDDVADLVAQIKANGFTDPLWVRAIDGGTYEVIDGSRRLRAVQIIVEQSPDAFSALPVDVIEADDAMARELALAANVTRSDLSPADEAQAFYRLKLSGVAVPDIAARFAAPERRVLQRIAIGSLPDTIIQALRRGSIDIETAHAFTLSTSPERQLEVFGDGKNLSAWRVNRALTETSVSGSSREAMFVGEAAYLAAGGTITRDLFGDEAWFDNAELLSTLFESAIEDKARALRDEGWGFVKVGLDYYNDLHKFPEIAPLGEAKDTPKQAAARAELEAKLAEAQAKADELNEKLQDLYEGDSDDEDAVSAAVDASDEADEEVARLAEKLAALKQRPWTAEQMAQNGAIIAFKSKEVVIVRGRAASAAKAKAQASKINPAADADGAPLPSPVEDAVDYSDGVIDILAAIATSAVMHELAQAKPALAARMGLAARVCSLYARSHLSPFEIRIITYSPFEALNVVGLADSFADVLAVLETMEPDDLVKLDAAVTAASFKLSHFSNSDAAFVLAQADPGMDTFKASGFDAAALLDRMSRHQLALIALEIDPENKVPKGKKPDMIAAILPKVTDSGWLPKQLRTPGYCGPGSATWDAAGDDTPLPATDAPDETKTTDETTEETEEAA